MGLQEEIADAVLLVRLYGVLVRLAQYGQGAVRYSAIAERRTSHWPVRSNPDILRGKNILRHYCMQFPPLDLRHPILRGPRTSISVFGVFAPSLRLEIRLYFPNSHIFMI